MKLLSDPSSHDTDVQNYRRIRTVIGCLGFIFPFVLVLLSFVPFFETKVQCSISSYYYTNFREIFTGVLCAVGLFLICYRGPVKNPPFLKDDSLLTNIAGTLAVLIAFFPTNPDACPMKIYTIAPWCLSWLGGLHYFFAGAFFLLLAYISIVIFTLGQKKEEGTHRHPLNENNIYRFSGWTIVFCVGMILLFGKWGVFRYSTLLFEAVALIAFGTTWLIKGRALGDKGKTGRILYREKN